MRLACVVSVFGLLVGCGDDEGVSISTNKDNFCGEIAEVACNNFYQCCSEGEIETLLHVGEPRTETQCRDDLRRLCERRSDTLFDSIKAGRVTFDAARLNDCLNSIVAPEDTCSAVVVTQPWKEACMNSSFVGTVPADGACFFAHDCAGAPDSFCAPNQKCQQKPASGFPCGTGCASQFYCSNGICQSRLAAGAPCTSTKECADQLFCDIDPNTAMGLCTARAPGGTACTSSAGCASGMCVPGQCMGTTQSCFRDMDCNSRCADDGSFCTTSANCASGTCSVGGNLCASDANCTASATDVCVFPVLCLPGDCIGDPVCTSAQLSVDYCEDTVSAIPLL